MSVGWNELHYQLTKVSNVKYTSSDKAYYSMTV